MKTCGILKFAAGYTAGVLTAVAGCSVLDKIVKEIKRDMGLAQTFVSPEGNHRVELFYGSSETAMGLTCIKIIVSSEKGNDCKLVVFARKRGDFVNAECEWSDNDRFCLLVGNGKRKQCWNVNFDGENVTAIYYLRKAND